MSGFFITGVDTGAGKTIVTASMIAYCNRQGIKTGYMKPIESGVDPKCFSSSNSDAQFLLEAAGDGADISEVCPIQLKTPASPYQACLIENKTIDLDLIYSAYRKLRDEKEVVLVEGIGGLSVPINRDVMLYDFIKELGLPLIVAVPMRLGALNHSLLTLRAANEENLKVAGIILVDLEDAHQDPVMKDLGKMINEFADTPILGMCPYLDPITPEIFNEKADFIFERMNLEKSVNWLDSMI